MKRKTGFLVFALILSVVLLIIAFQNVTTKSQFWMFFESKSMPMAFPVLVISVVGMITGSLFTLYLQSLVGEKKEIIRKEDDLTF